MKRITALLAAAAVTLTGCGLVTEPKRGATLEIDPKTSYVSEKFDRNGMELYPLSVTPQGVTFSWSGSPKSPASKLYLYSFDDGAFREFGKHQTDTPRYVTQLPDGRLAAIYAKGEWVRGDYVYDMKSRVMEIYDDDLQYAEEMPLPEDMPAGYLWDGELVMLDDGRWIMHSYDDNLDNGLWLLDKAFHPVGEIDTGGLFVNRLLRGGSGTAYMIAGQELFSIDTDSMTCSRIETPTPHGSYLYISGGVEELYYADSNLYALHADGTRELLVDLHNSDLPNGLSQVFALPDGTFLYFHQDLQDTTQNGWYRLRPRTQEELDSVQFITLAGVNLRQQLLLDICAWNMAHSDYHILMKDYADDYPPELTDHDKEMAAWDGSYRQYLQENDPARFQPAIDAFKRDLLDGIVPDIVQMDGLPANLLANKGILTDLSPLLEESEEFQESDYLMNILDGLRTGDRLDRVGFSFLVDTAAAKTELVGTQQGRTPEEYYSMLQSRPEGTDIFPATSRESILDTYLIGSQNAFIDRGTNTCSFQSENFVKLLELAASFDTSVGQTETEYWDAIQYSSNFAENKSLLREQRVSQPMDIHSVWNSEFRRADITLVGYPETQGGNGGKYQMLYTVGLTSRSLHTAPVLDYILTGLSKKRQARICIRQPGTSLMSIPVRRESFENTLKAATIPDYSGQSMSEAEISVFRDYVEGLHMYEDNDSFITSIITEEAEKYFAGDQTSQQAADNIQSRVSLYLSEQG